MGAVPKRKISRHRRGNRRRHQYLIAPQLSKCPNCGESNLSHRACKSCGQFKGRQVVEMGGDDEE